MMRDIYADWYADALAHAPRANKALGQHFIHDFGILEKIAASANIAQTETIFEIGPGAGGLTAAILAMGAKKLIAIEKDKILAENLQSLVKISQNRLEIIHADARKFEMRQAVRPAIIIANLPYHAGTHLLGQYLDRADGFLQMVLMFQREVGCRLTARINSGEYGRLSVLAQARAEIKTVMTLPPGAFRPAPKIASSVIDFKMRDLPGLDYPALKKLTSLLFSQRRKKMQTILASYGIAKQSWSNAPIDGNQRAENVTPEEFIQLTRWAMPQLNI